jgi:hypothetical protein
LNNFLQNGGVIPISVVTCGCLRLGPVAVHALGVTFRKFCRNKPGKLL